MYLGPDHALEMTPESMRTLLHASLHREGPTAVVPQGGNLPGPVPWPARQAHFMNARLPLPEHLGHHSFSTAELKSAGVDIQRTKAQDLHRFAQGMYRPSTAHPSAWRHHGRPEPMHGFSPSDLRALLRHHQQAVLSHLSAAHLFEIPVPGHASATRAPHRLSARTLHLTIQKGRRLRRKATVEHRRLLGNTDITSLFGLRVTAAARTWLDLATMQPLMDLHALVVAGDFVVNPPWLAGIGRTDPLTNVQEIHQAMDRAGRFVGISAAREALSLVRVGADSPQETRLRLAIVDAGLPEPGLQISVDPSDPWAPHADLGFPQWKIAIQYEGAHHRDRRQQEIDARRDEWFQAHGWIVIKVTSADTRQGFRRVTDRIARHIASAAR